LALGLMVLIFGSIAGSLGKRADKVKVKANSVLQLSFADPQREWKICRFLRQLLYTR